MGQSGATVVSTLGVGRGCGATYPCPRPDRDVTRHARIASRGNQVSGRANTPAHQHQRARCTRNKGGCGKGTFLMEQAEALGEPPEDPLLFSRPLRLLGRQLCGIQRRCMPRSRGSVLGACRETEDGSCSVVGYRAMGVALSTSGDFAAAQRITIWALPFMTRPYIALWRRDLVKTCECEFISAVVDPVGPRLSRSRASRRSSSPQGGARDWPSGHVNGCTLHYKFDPYLIWKPLGSGRTI